MFNKKDYNGLFFGDKGSHAEILVVAEMGL